MDERTGSIINASSPYSDSEEESDSDESKIMAAKRYLNRDRNKPAADEEKTAEGGFTKFTGRQARLFELKLKFNEARKANQTAMDADIRRKEAPASSQEYSRGVSTQKWLEQRKRKIGKLLEANGLDTSRAYMLDTQEAAEAKYKKRAKEPAPFGWEVFNQRTLYGAYKRRAEKIEVDLEEYNRMKEADPEFYRGASSLQYGTAPKISEDKIERMVKELKDQEEKRKSFSRRRRFHDEKDVDSINHRNEHFNSKIERAYGKYTLDIKNNLERGTAL